MRGVVLLSLEAPVRMTRENPSKLRRRFSMALIGALVLLAGLFPSATLADEVASQRYMVVFKGGYALDGSYALGKGYALVTEHETYALDSTYALERSYALYALNRTYALLDQYALSDEYALAEDYALFGQYALDSGYALARDYALGDGYALARATAGYALDSSYALLDSTAGNYLGSGYALLDAYALDENYALARDYALYALSMAGGTITSDLSRQIGVFVVDSTNALFAQTMKTYALVQYVGQDFGVDMFPSYSEAIGSGQLEVWDSRSEEHTSELQSPCNLVCRLLLEKKNKSNNLFKWKTKEDAWEVFSIEATGANNRAITYYLISILMLITELSVIVRFVGIRAVAGP